MSPGSAGATCHDRGGAAVATANGAGPDGRTGGAPPLVALVGPPNAGKTTLYNQLTGLRQKVANYPGVTVEKHVGRVRLEGEREVRLVDLPGVNGFTGRTLDERVTRDVLAGRVEGLPRPDAILAIVDATRLETQLMLIEPILEMGRPTLLLLNMVDELEARGGRIQDGALAERFGVRVARTNARAGHGLERVREFLSAVAAGELDGGTPAWNGRSPAAPGEETAVAGFGARRNLPVLDAFAERRARVRSAVEAADHRPPEPSALSERLDAILLHRVWGPLVFLAVVLVVFQAIFTWAAPLIDGLEWIVATSGEWLAPHLPSGWVRSLIIDGVWSGVGSVVVFLPQILLLFLFLAVLEDSGYIARAAVIADRLMYRVGLQGRAFLPLISGYACAVPAILSARTVENERDRLATIFVTPFMTCSARLPVYALLIAAFIPAKPLLGPVLGSRTAVLLGLYGLGLIAAIGTAFLLKRTLLRGGETGFMMELPPYRLPSPKSVGLRLLDRSRIFFSRAGKIIFTVTIALWLLTQVPRTPQGPPPIGDSVLGRVGHVIEPVIEPLGFDWTVGVGLVSSLAAREVIVGTLGTIYGVEDASESSISLQSNLRQHLDTGAAVALLVFFAFALQCTSTIAVMRRETGGWKWPAIQFGYMLAMAFSGAWLANWLL